MQVDYIIIGQGICGTLLSRALMRAGQRVLVVDDAQPNSASKVASGIMNPVTGKRWVESWMTGVFTPLAVQTYRELEAELSVPLVRNCDVLNFHYGDEARAMFEAKAAKSEYLSAAEASDWERYFYFHHGVGEVAPCWLLDVALLLERWRAHLVSREAYWQTACYWNKMELTENGVRYGEIEARSVISCSGVADKANPYFGRLPFTDNKGEVLLVRIPDLPKEHIYKRGVSIVPWQDNVFWVGASFEWAYENVQPTEQFRLHVRQQLDEWLRLQYEIVDHLVAERPTTMGYKPFVGMHPKYPQLGIMNGMGTKGCSMAPYFAEQLCQHLTAGEAILPDADTQRFKNILLR